MSYDMIDLFLRNNLGDDDYAKYSDALNALCTPQRTWVGLTDEEVMEIAFNFDVPSLVVRTVEAKLRSKNEDRN